MRTARTHRVLLLGVLCSGLAVPGSAATWYVTQAGTGDATTIQSGIALASPGDTVLVAPGVYTDTIHVTIQGVEKVANVHLAKDISLVAQGDTTNTIISGPNSDVAVFVEGVGGGGLIQGFRVSTVFAVFLCPDPTSVDRDVIAQIDVLADFRVGIRCENSAITIQRCELTSHGVAVQLNASPVTVRDCSFGHVARGVECHSESDALIDGNRWYWTGGAVTSEASSPVIVENQMGGGGEMCVAISCSGGGAPYIARNAFRDVYYQTIQVGAVDAIIEDNLFINGSTAIFISAGMRTPVVRSNVFYDHGGWVIVVWTSAPIIQLNTIDSVNSAPGKRGIVLDGANPLVQNNILMRLSAGISCAQGATPTIVCNNIYSTVYPYHDECPNQTGINGNITVDPEFCGNWDSMDYRLQSDSPCAPGNHPDGYDCGQIGAKGVGCSTTPTKKSSWGAVKALYRKGDGK